MSDPTPKLGTTLGAAGRTSEAAAIIEAVKDLAGVHTIPLDALGTKPEAILAPKGMTAISLKPLLDEYRVRPERVRQTVALASGDALIAYTNRFKTDATLGFFDATASLSALIALDWHEPGGPLDQGWALASRITHLASYHFPLSDELSAWMEAAREPKTSEEFAEFLQDRECDVESPPFDWHSVSSETLAEVLAALNLHDDKAAMDGDGNYLLPPDTDAEDTYIPRSALYKLRQIRFGTASQIVGLARSIEVSSTARARNAYDPKTGARAVIFQEDNETTGGDGRKVKVPDAFFLFVPVFRGEAPRLIPVRLSYRVRGTAIVWGLDIIDANRMIERAITATAARIEEETGITMLRGLPIGPEFTQALNAEAQQNRQLVATR